MKKTLLFLLLTLFCTSLISPLRAADETEKKYDIASGEIELVDFIEEVRQILDIQIIYDTAAIQKGKKIYLNIKPLTQTEYLALLKTILTQQDLLFYADGEGDSKIYFICKQSEISKLPLNPNDPDGLSLVVVPIKHVSTNHIISKLNNITGTTGRPGAITPIEQTNSLIIKGTTEYIDFVTELIKTLDVIDAAPVTEIIHLRYKDPAAMIELYNAHQKAVQTDQKMARSSIVSMTPDESNKAVIITAPQREIATILDFIKKFDVAPALDPAQEIITTEYPVNNLAPEEVARMISEVFQTRGTIVVGADKSGDSASSSKKKDSEEVESVASPFDIEENEKPIIVYGQGQRTLIITTSRRIHERIVQLMTMIDKQTPLVFIQAALVSVAYGEGLDIGVQFSTIGKRGPGTDVVGTSNFGLTDLTSNAAYRLDVMTDIISRGLTLGIARGNDNLIPFVINLSQTSSDVKVHSMPSVMTDNEKTSTFTTKDNAPVKVIKESAEGGTSTTSSEYESADISISITPSIREGGKIKLNLALVIESFSGTSSDPGLAPPKVSNNFNGDITVTDGKTLVIGGLISEKTSNTANKVPILGDLPLLGFLFRSTSESVSKDVLYVFITATILRTQEDEDKLTDEAQKDIEDAKKSAKKDEKEAQKEDATNENENTDNKDSDEREKSDKSADEKPNMVSPKDDADESE